MSTIVLNGVVLNPNMVWVDRYHSQMVEQSFRRTLGGSPVVYSASVPLGTNITLEATEDYGWLEKLSQVDPLVAIADVAGGIYPFIFNGVSYSVMFRHHEAPALELTPLVPRVAHATGDYFIGQIKLMTV